MAQPDYIRRANKRKGKLPAVEYEESQPPKKKKKKRVRPMAFKKRGEESYAEQASRTNLAKWVEAAAKQEETTSLINVTATRHHVSMASGLDEVCHLCKLPRELRDRIYEYAYTDEDLTALGIGTALCVIIPAEDLAPQHSAAVHIDGEKPPDEVPRVLLRPLAANKQFLVEALPMKVRNTLFRLGTAEDFEVFVASNRMIRENISTVVLDHSN